MPGRHRFQTFSLIVVLSTTWLLPFGAQASSGPPVTLEQAIQTVKANFQIPKQFTNFSSGFNSNGSGNGGSQNWSLTWGAGPNQPGQLNATVDAVTGEILSENLWTNPGSSSSPSLSASSQDAALQVATKLLTQLEPDRVKDLKLVNDSTPVLSTGTTSYNFHWERLVQGIPFPQDGVRMTVGAGDHQVTSYSFQWTPSEFPDASQAISQAQAAAAFKNANLFQLQYLATSPEPGPVFKKPAQTSKVILAYQVYQVYSATDGAIDALTGQPLNPTATGGWVQMFGAGGPGNWASLPSSAHQDAVTLSPQELQDIQKNASLLTQDEAVAAVTKWVDLPTTLTLNNANLQNYWNDPSRQIWNLNWTAPDQGQVSPGQLAFASATVDAATGELLSLNLNYQSPPNGTGQLDRTAAQKIAEDFLNRIEPAKFGQVRLSSDNPEPGPRPLAAGPNPPFQSFAYQRVVNGLVFPGNGFNIGVDTATGHLTSYNLNWTNPDFPAPTGAMSLSKAQDAFLAAQPLTLDYIQTYDQKGPGQVYLVYQPTPPPGTPSATTIDAQTGQLLDGQGQPIKSAPEAHTYTDIQGNFAADDINLLGQSGILAEYGTTFHPDEKITTVALFRALLMINWEQGAATLTDKEVLDQAHQRNWLTSDEKPSPSDPVSRENLAKYLIRSLNLTRAAQIQGIYQLPAADAGNVTPGDLGYAALAWGLDLMRGDGHLFRPTDAATRAEVAVTLVRVLQLGPQPGP